MNLNLQRMFPPEAHAGQEKAAPPAGSEIMMAGVIEMPSKTAAAGFERRLDRKFRMMRIGRKRCSGNRCRDVIEELQHQAAERLDGLRVSQADTGVHVDGDIDVDPLVMVAAGAVAGGF